MTTFGTGCSILSSEHELAGDASHDMPDTDPVELSDKPMWFLEHTFFERELAIRMFPDLF